MTENKVIVALAVVLACIGVGTVARADIDTPSWRIYVSQTGNDVRIEITDGYTMGKNYCIFRTGDGGPKLVVDFSQGPLPPLSE